MGIRVIGTIKGCLGNVQSRKEKKSQVEPEEAIKHESVEENTKTAKDTKKE